MSNLPDSIILAPFTRRGVSDVYRAAFNDSEVTRHNSHGLFQKTDAEIEEFFKSIDRGERVVWAVKKQLDKSDKNHSGYPLVEIHLGNISLQSFNWINRSAELAVLFWDKDNWGKGIATAACRQLIEHGFYKMNLNRIWTGTAETNIGMQRVADKLGFIAEGRMRQAVYLRGEYRDVLNYGLLRDEYKKPENL